MPAPCAKLVEESGIKSPGEPGGAHRPPGSLLLTRSRADRTDLSSSCTLRRADARQEGRMDVPRATSSTPSRGGVPSGAGRLSGGREVRRTESWRISPPRLERSALDLTDPVDCKVELAPLPSLRPQHLAR